MFQSTHPHGVRRHMASEYVVSDNVSIHAPTRGATSQPCTCPSSISCFNPRTHTGCDVISFVDFRRLSVSIHAPTRGATSAFSSLFAPQCLFQSTHPHGVRQSRQQHAILITKFQSTHPHGVRLAKYAAKHILWQFQSTHPHGVRLTCPLSQRIFPRFNPRTHTGCDARPARQSNIAVGFQSTHPHGVRPRCTVSVVHGISVSIHAPTRGATCPYLSQSVK